MGLRVIDGSDSGGLIEIGRFLPEREKFDVQGLDVAWPYAYLAAGYSGFSVVDVSDPWNPVEVGHYDTPRAARSVQVSGNYAYVSDLKWVRVFDISIPAAPREIASYEAPATTRDLWIQEAGVYVAAQEAGLMILDFDAQGQ